MADIEKLAVYDSRVVQERPRFAVDKGALAITNSPFSAIGNSSSQLTFNVSAPSLNVFLDRKVEWTAGVNMAMTVNVASPPAAGTLPAVGVNSIPVVVFGRDCALAAHPLQFMVSTMTATINDAVVSQNTGDILYEVARLVDTTPAKLTRTTPSYLDKYARYNTAVGAINNPLGSYFDATDYENLPNGSYFDIAFVKQDGSPIAATGADTYTSTIGGVSSTINTFNGIPVLTAVGSPAATVATYQVFFRFTATEKLFVSPFIWNEAVGDEVGLFGLNNFQLVLNMKGDVSRLVRNAPLATQTQNRTIYGVQFLNTSPFVNPRLNCLFLTPPLDINLPSRSVLQYLEYPRYVSSQADGTTIAPLSSQPLVSSTITLPVLPDMLIIYCKPSQYGTSPTPPAPYPGVPFADGAAFGDFYCPITQISINFDNYSGLLASHTRQQLYAISAKNGLRMDYNTWSGLGKVSNPSAAALTAGTSPVNAGLVGGFLVLKMGEDIPLQAGQASGVVGNYTLQFNCQAFNQTGTTITPQLYVIAVNSGYFESQSGSSRIIRGVLTEQDVISAPPAGFAARSQMERIVGGGFLSKLGSALSRAKEVIMSPEGRSVVKGLARQSGIPALQRGADVASALGFGVGGMATGGAMTGGRMTGGRRRKGAALDALM